MQEKDGVCIPEAKDKKDSPPVNGSEKIEESVDISAPGLLKELGGYFTLTKHGKRSVCPHRPERTRREIDAKSGKVLNEDIITPSCSSFCPHFRAVKDKEEFAVTISCGNESVIYAIPEKNYVVSAPSKAAEQGTKDGKMGLVK